MEINMQPQIVKSIGDIVEQVVQENLFGFKLTKVDTIESEKMEVLQYQLQRPKSNFILAFNIHIPKTFVSTEFRKIGFTVNEVIKFFQQNLKDYTLSELIRETPTKWRLVFDIVLDSVLNPAKIIKHIIIIPDELYYIKISEDLNSAQFTITVHKKYERLMLNKIQLKSTLISLNRLKELALYDTQYKYRKLIYTIRLIPIVLAKYSIHKAFKFNNLTLIINNTIITVKTEKGFKFKTVVLPLNMIQNQAWQEYLIRGIYAKTVCEL